MATIDLTSNVQRRWSPGLWQPGVFQLYNKADFSAANAASGDTIQVLPIPAGTLVLGVAHIVETAEGGTSTTGVGDGNDTDYFLSGADNNATAGTALLSYSQTKVDLISGGSAGDHTVTGITTSDALELVLHNTGGTLADLTSEFSIASDNTINNGGGTDTSSDDLLVFWKRKANRYYSSVDTIDMALSANAVDTAVISLVAWCVEVAY